MLVRINHRNEVVIVVAVVFLLFFLGGGKGRLNKSLLLCQCTSLEEKSKGD